MKCPKCGYLGFERVERCRNCGYDFSLTDSYDLPEIQIRDDSASEQPFDDLTLINRTPSPATPGHMPPAGRLPFGHAVDDRPLITRPSPPRTPLSVRRATPDVQRPRPSTARMPMLDLSGEVDLRLPAAQARATEWPEPEENNGLQTAAISARLAAVVLDFVILAAIDAVVIYFTMQICGLTFDDVSILPKGPMLAFLLVQNGGYLVAFTAGGQTLGKMAAGIKVVPATADAPLDLGHSIVRTLVWAALVVPAGLGLLTTLLSHDRRGLHDHFAGTRVVRATL